MSIFNCWYHIMNNIILSPQQVFHLKIKIKHKPEVTQKTEIKVVF